MVDLNKVTGTHQGAVLAGHPPDQEYMSFCGGSNENDSAVTRVSVDAIARNVCAFVIYVIVRAICCDHW